MKTFRKWLKQYEQYVIPAMLLLGVVFDFVTFQTLKIETTLTVLGIYLVVAAGLIALSYTNKKHALTLLSPVTQFTFGALLSASLVFYWFSGSLSVSWPILLVLAALIASNEVFRTQFLKPTAQITVLYFSLFSYLTIALPHLLNTIAAWVFVASGIISLLALLLFTNTLAKYAARIETRKKHIARAIIGVFVIMNGLYALNIIPPIPLALRDAGVFHAVTRTSAGYTLKQEPESFLERLIPGQTLNIQKGKPAYVFTSIFAPTELNTHITHKWEHFDKEQSRWETKSNLSFPIIGGRADGYRGFSKKTSLQEGMWRVSVQTPGGQTLGRISFRVQFTQEPPALETVNK